MNERFESPPSPQQNRLLIDRLQDGKPGWQNQAHEENAPDRYRSRQDVQPSRQNDQSDFHQPPARLMRYEIVTFGKGTRFI